MGERFSIGSTTKTILSEESTRNQLNELESCVLRTKESDSVALLPHRRATVLRKNMYPHHNPWDPEGKKDN